MHFPERSVQILIFPRSLNFLTTGWNMKKNSLALYFYVLKTYMKLWFKKRWNKYIQTIFVQHTKTKTNKYNVQKIKHTLRYSYTSITVIEIIYTNHEVSHPSNSKQEKGLTKIVSLFKLEHLFVNECFLSSVLCL